MNKTYIDWVNIERLVKLISKNLQKPEFLHISQICGLPRGGLIPAVMLSHQTNIPLVTLEQCTLDKTLFIDDICDSGDTFARLDGQFIGNICTAALFKRFNSNYEPTITAETIKNEDWLVFPWEKEDSKTIQDYKL